MLSRTTSSTLALVALLLGLSLTNPSNAQYAGAYDPLVSAMLVQRESLFDNRGIDVSALSLDIGAAVREGEQLEAKGQYQLALDRLLVLQKYMPLRDLPAFEVHQLASWLYDKLGQKELGLLHSQRASAYRVLLHQRIGSGNSPDDPLRVVMANEVRDWAKINLASIASVETTPYKGKEQMVVTYQGLVTGNQPRKLFVEIDRRTQSMASQRMDRYAPVPLHAMSAEDAAFLASARERRARFLADRSYSSSALRDKIRTLLAQSAELDMQGKPREALEKLREIESLRPIEEIPTPRWLAWYSYLQGKLGNTAKQREMRGLLFGAIQAMAHSGDGLSPATAVHVILIEEEYEWIREKKLKPVRQALLERDGQHYDVMTVEDAKGVQTQVFFNITGLYARRSLGLEAAPGSRSVVNEAAQPP